MIVQDIYLKDWDWFATIYYAVDSYYADEILDNLESLGCNYRELTKVEAQIKNNEHNTGFTYSNFQCRCSIVVIGLTTSAEQFQNTFDHEKGHLAMHIAEACNIDILGEEFQYLTGEIGQKMFRKAKRFLCDRCREGLINELER